MIYKYSCNKIFICHFHMCLLTLHIKILVLSSFVCKFCPIISRVLNYKPNLSFLIPKIRLIKSL
jgi:hypothetical protein